MAGLIVLALLVPAGVGPLAAADHQQAQAEEVCPQEAVDNVWPSNPLPDLVGCIDNELTAPGAHAEVLELEITTEGCTAGSVLCEVSIEAEAEHWAWRPRSSGELRVYVVGPTGTATGYDECETGDGFEFRGTCYSEVAIEHLAPTGPIDEVEVDHDGWPPPEVSLSPGTFCVQVLAETTPWGTEGYNDERDEDPARDLAGTCIDVGQRTFNGLP